MIFISYRRADSETVVGRIYSELKKHFPTKDVFLDHDSIPLGKPFLDVIRERLATSKFALVLIGPQWCSIKDEKTGRCRLDDPNDFVRLEVETALNTPAIDVIPLWVMRATSSPDQIAALPSSLQPLFKNNGMPIRPVPDEDYDIQRLIARLSRQSEDAGVRPGRLLLEGRGSSPGISGKHPYDWASEVGEMGYAVLRQGMAVLFEERSLDPSFDETQYRKNRQVRVPATPHRVSPRGFVKITESDLEWLDPRDRNRRICEARIREVFPDGRVRFSGTPVVLGDIVDILEDGFVGSPSEGDPLQTALLGLYESYPGDRAEAARKLGRLGPLAVPAIPALIKALKDSSGPVRIASAWALRAIGTPNAISAADEFERR